MTRGGRRPDARTGSPPPWPRGWRTARCTDARGRAAASPSWTGPTAARTRSAGGSSSAAARLALPWTAVGAADAAGVHRTRSAASGRAARRAPWTSAWRDRWPCGRTATVPVLATGVAGGSGADARAASRPPGWTSTDMHVVVTPHRPVACAGPGIAARLAGETTEASVTLPWRASPTCPGSDRPLTARRSGDVAVLPVPRLGLLAAGGRPVGCTNPKRPAFAVIQVHCGVPATLMPPHRSTASAQPWFEVPGTAASAGLRANADTCAGEGPVGVGDAQRCAERRLVGGRSSARRTRGVAAQRVAVARPAGTAPRPGSGRCA